MAVTQTQIDKLKAAMASGALSVRDGRREVTYRSMQEMREQLARMENELAAASGTNRIRRIRVGLTR